MLVYWRGMDMLEISRVLCELIKEYIESFRQKNMEWRLIVPGLTRKISHEIHEYLRLHGIESYLVVGNETIPNQDNNWISPIGLTSKRIESFVAIASPGQLVHIQDSVLGSGGVIRDLPFGEEWPWIDDGNESFRFDGPVLERLLSSWCKNETEKEWLRNLILDGLVKSTISVSQRATLLLEEIIGGFTPELYPELGSDTCKKFLYHAGIPYDSEDLEDVKGFIKRTERLCQKIIEKCQKEENVREQAYMQVSTILENKKDEVSSYQESVDIFLDGLNNSSGRGILSFYACWGKPEKGVLIWERLDQSFLSEVFLVNERPEGKICRYDVLCNRGVISNDKRSVATFKGEILTFKVAYQVPKELLGKHAWKIELLQRGKMIDCVDINREEDEVELRFDTSSYEGSYKNRIVLKISLKADNETKEEKVLSLYICGEQKPVFAIVYPEFVVVNAVIISDNEPLRTGIDVKEPVHVYLLSNLCNDLKIRDMNNKEIPTIEENQGIWRTMYQADPSRDPNNMIEYTCWIGDYTICLSIEPRDIEKGEFTLEDEFRNRIAGISSGNVREILDMFSGKVKKPFLRLGKLNDMSRRRCLLARQMSSPSGWKPIVLDLLSPDFSIIGTVEDYIVRVGNINIDELIGIHLRDKEYKLLNSYCKARQIFIELISSNMEEVPEAEHPLYAMYPIYINEKATKIENLLIAYLKAYRDILDYIRLNINEMNWLQLFVLVYLDCVVHWGMGPLKNSIFLLGPWHPLVVAKRYMVQAALYERAIRLEEKNGKVFRELATLLDGIQGFRWILGVSADNIALEHLYVCATSDPGWHVAFKTNINALLNQVSVGNLDNLINEFRIKYDMFIKLSKNEVEEIPIISLNSYLKAFPSRRTIGIRIKNGYPDSYILKQVDKYLHDEEAPTTDGLKLPGGVHLYFARRIGELDNEIQWTNPSIQVHYYENDIDCFKEENVDIYMISPDQKLLFRNTLSSEITIPRGKGQESVFCESLHVITSGQDQVPRSFIIENEMYEPNEPSNSLGDLYKWLIGSIVNILGNCPSLMQNVSLPLRLDSQWAIVPGKDIDPAILVNYVRDGIERSLQERVLWDYRMSVGSKSNSFYILSNIPRSFVATVKSIFDREDLASEFIMNLGKIGVAVCGESLKSGKHSIGIIGMVVAVRLFFGIGSYETGPLMNSERQVSFLIPIDSFSSFFSNPGHSSDGDTRRSDLLAVCITLPDPVEQKIKISACSIETKFVSGTYNRTMANKALEQARNTAQQFRLLAENGLKPGSVPERLGLLSLLKFGLRLVSPSDRSLMSPWLGFEYQIYKAVLQGQYEYSTSKYQSVLVTTEKGLEGPAETMELQGDLWIRLNLDHWPGYRDTDKIKEIRRNLKEIFRMKTSNKEIDQLKQDEVEHIDEKGELKEKTPIIQPVDEHKKDSVIQHDQVNKINNDTQHVVTSKELPLRKIFIGVNDGRMPVYYDPQSPDDPLDNLNIMITGSSGKGKTQLLKYLVCKLREEGKNVLILDFKNDYASDKDFVKHNDTTSVFVSLDGLPYNPLIPYPITHPATGEQIIQCGQHIAGIASVLKQTYNLGVQQQVAVKNAIVDAFSSMGLSTGIIKYQSSLQFPDLNDVGTTLLNNYRTAYNRLDPLFTLDLFKAEHRDKSFHSLVSKSYILDLSLIPSEEIKNALAQIVVLSAHAYYNSQPQTGKIKQVLVFDEAHRVLKSDYILRLVRECRAYGVCVILSSQYPSDFSSEIAAAMATKIIHGNDANYEKVKSIVQLVGADGLETEISNLGRFEALFDNRHFTRTFIRTMNYPLYLLWSYINEQGEIRIDEMINIDGLDTNKLPLKNLVHQLELLGLVEVRGSKAVLLKQVM